MSYILYNLQKIFSLIEQDAFVSINDELCVPVFTDCKYSERKWEVSEYEADYLRYIYLLAAQRALDLPDVPIARSSEFLMNVICVSYKYFSEDYGNQQLVDNTVETYCNIICATTVKKFILDIFGLSAWNNMWLEKTTVGELLLFVDTNAGNSADNSASIDSTDVSKTLHTDTPGVFSMHITDEFNENMLRHYMNIFGRTCAINASNICLVMEACDMAIKNAYDLNIDIGQDMTANKNEDSDDEGDNNGDNEVDDYDGNIDNEDMEQVD